MKSAVKGDPFAPIKLPVGFWVRVEMIEALEARDFGAVFRLVRKYSGESQTRIGRLTGFDQGKVSEIMRNLREIETLDVLLRVADGLQMPDSARHLVGLRSCQRGIANNSTDAVELETGPAQIDDAPATFAESWEGSALRASELWRNDVQRRSFLAWTGSAFMVPAVKWLADSSEVPARHGGGDQLVGSPDVATVQEMTRTFQRLDNRYGGAHSRQLVLRYLNGDVAPMLTAGRFDAATGAALFASAAELARLAGWMAYDSGEHGAAQAHLIHALRLAKVADDQPLGAEILAAMSHQAIYLKDPDTAITLASAARKTAEDAHLPALAAEACVSEAHGYALRGDERACTRALTAAEDALDRGDRAADPQFMEYFDAAYLSARFGQCFSALGRGEQTTRFADRSLDMDMSYVRGRTFNLALLAKGHVQQGEIERAAVVALEAAERTTEIRSARAIDYVRDLDQALAGHSENTAVREFRDFVAAQITAAHLPNA
ncbi:helix-turn-helix domain-containing protein [Fodinicola feengrottensis]|uniref:helix-turn-helix domain-containing protein n=1 Tax=Fodinicola feengrottensis TaxID=435914 RepID=UPI0031D3B1D5